MNKKVYYLTLVFLVLVFQQAASQAVNFQFEYHRSKVYDEDFAAVVKEKNPNTAIPFTKEQLAKINRVINESVDVFMLQAGSDSSVFTFKTKISPPGLVDENRKKLDIGNIWLYKKIYQTKTLQMIGKGINQGTCTSLKPLQDLVDWKLVEGDTTINGYECKKAIDQISGAFAWYTFNLPVSDGPKYYSGLPGLVVMLVNEKNNEKYTLVSVSKLESITVEGVSCKEEISYETYIKNRVGATIVSEKKN